jgi:hypothetical protein
MEWLLVIALHLPATDYHSGLRFASYKDCIEAGSKVLSGEMRPVLVKADPQRVVIKKRLQDLADISETYDLNLREHGHEKASRIRARALRVWNSESNYSNQLGSVRVTYAVLRNEVKCEQVSPKHSNNSTTVHASPNSETGGVK